MITKGRQLRLYRGSRSRRDRHCRMFGAPMPLVLGFRSHQLPVERGIVAVECSQRCRWCRLSSRTARLSSYHASSPRCFVPVGAHWRAQR